MQFKDEIYCHIEEDGTITVTTDKVSKENHLAAEKMLSETFEALGGEVKKVQRPHSPHSHHSHVHGSVGNH